MSSHEDVERLAAYWLFKNVGCHFCGTSQVSISATAETDQVCWQSVVTHVPFCRFAQYKREIEAGRDYRSQELVILSDIAGCCFGCLSSISSTAALRVRAYPSGSLHMLLYHRETDQTDARSFIKSLSQAHYLRYEVSGMIVDMDPNVRSPCQLLTAYPSSMISLTVTAAW